MKTAIILNWPEMPALPPPGQPVLIRVATALDRPTARQELRTALRALLAGWSNLSPEQLPLGETTSGPVWSGALGGHSLDISLSYADGEGWMGLVRAGTIGVDVLPIQSIPEAEAVAQLYLGPDKLLAIQQSAAPAVAFAMAWTALEARLKCLKQPLRELPAALRPALKKCAVQNWVQPNRRMVAVAVIAG